MEGVPISDPCDERGLQPTVFYRWQNQFFSDYFPWADFPGVDSKSTGRPEETWSDESFSLVSPYSSVSKPQEDSPLIRGEGIPVPGGAQLRTLHCFSVAS